MFHGSEVAQPCLTVCFPMDCSLPGSSVHGIFQARVLEWVAIYFSRGSSQPRDLTWVSHIVGRCFYCLSYEGSTYFMVTEYICICMCVYIHTYLYLSIYISIYIFMLFYERFPLISLLCSIYIQPILWSFIFHFWNFCLVIFQINLLLLDFIMFCFLYLLEYIKHIHF